MSSSRVKNDVLDFNPKLFSSEIIYLSEEIMGKYRDSVVGALEVSSRTGCIPQGRMTFARYPPKYCRPVLASPINV
jgi:hypothetical protein